MGRDDLIKETVVKHKKNFQRALNYYANRYNYIDMEINSYLQVCTFCCSQSFSSILDVSKMNIVYDKELSKKQLLDYNSAIQAIESMFEHSKHIEILKTIVDEHVDTIKLNEIIFKQTDFFKDKDTTINRIYEKFEEQYGIHKFNEKFISKLYTTVRNRTIYKFLYSNSDGNYYTFSESAKYRYGTYIKYNKKSVSKNKTAQIELILKTHYDYYKKHIQLFSVKALQAYAYFIKKSNLLDIPEDYGIDKEWRDKYYFIKRHGIDESLEKSILFIYNYLEPFINKENKLVNISAKDGRVFAKSVAIFLNENNIQTNYSPESLAIMHRAVQKVIPDIKEQQDIVETANLPSFDNYIKHYQYN